MKKNDLVSPSGMMIGCKLVRETKKAWIVNYCDKAYPGDKRIPKDGERQLFDNVDDAFKYLGIEE